MLFTMVQDEAAFSVAESFQSTCAAKAPVIGLPFVTGAQYDDTSSSPAKKFYREPESWHFVRSPYAGNLSKLEEKKDA